MVTVRVCAFFPSFSVRVLPSSCVAAACRCSHCAIDRMHAGRREGRGRRQREGKGERERGRRRGQHSERGGDRDTRTLGCDDDRVLCRVKTTGGRAHSQPVKRRRRLESRVVRLKYVDGHSCDYNALGRTRTHDRGESRRSAGDNREEQSSGGEQSEGRGRRDSERASGERCGSEDCGHPRPSAA